MQRSSDRSSSSLSVGIVGCGEQAQVHVAAWRRLKGVKVVAVCDTDETRAASAATRWKVPSYYTSLTDMLTKSPVSVVSIVTPPQSHADLAIEAMESGCDVLLEKPFTSTTQEADRVVDYYRCTQRKLTVAHNFLFFPAMIKARSLVQKDALGQICGAAIFCSRTKFDPMDRDPNHWSHQMKGARIAETIPHPLYLLTPFLDELSVSSVSVSKVGEYPWMPVDEATIVLKSANGALAIISIMANAARDEVIVEVFGDRMHLRVNIFRNLVIQNTAVNYFEPSWRGATLWSKGTANLGEAFGSVTATIKAVASAALRTNMGPHEAIIASFRKSITEGYPPPVDPVEAREVVRLSEEVCEKIDQQIREQD